jgi:hypothetical protein
MELNLATRGEPTSTFNNFSDEDDDDEELNKFSFKQLMKPQNIKYDFKKMDHFDELINFYPISSSINCGVLI